ncbi:MAG: RpiB/LacA/LacB family sugar-phosphate isomerase [bacterium]
MKIYIGSDHVGFEFKEELKKYLSELNLGYEIEDKGALEYNKDDDYPDFIKLVAEAVASNVESKGIIIGGSGQGEAICANRVKGIRAVVFYGPKEAVGTVDVMGRESSDTFELVKLAREHNNANVLSLGLRFQTVDEARFAVELFLATKFPGDERHIRRINKID